MSDLSLWLCSKCYASGLIEGDNNSNAEAEHMAANPLCSYSPSIFPPSAFVLRLAKIESAARELVEQVDMVGVNEDGNIIISPNSIHYFEKLRQCFD